MLTRASSSPSHSTTSHLAPERCGALFPEGLAGDGEHGIVGTLALLLHTTGAMGKKKFSSELVVNS